MRAIFQFFVLFAGPLGLMALTGLVISRWVWQSRRRREPRTPDLQVLPGGADAARDAHE